MNITVDEAMKPLDDVANKLKQIRRKEDKSEIDSAVEEVKKGVKAAILEDVTAALGGMVEIQEIKPAPMRPAPKKAGGKKVTTKKAEPVKAEIAPVVATPKVKGKTTGKKVPLDAKGLTKPELPTIVTPAPVAPVAPVKKVNKGKGKATVKATTPNVELRGTSTVLKPTKLVWSIAEGIIKKNPKATRKDILAACDKAGITYYTARTQYQLWRSSKGK